MDIEALEAELVSLAEQLTDPLPQECLWHYLDRVVLAHGCTAHRFTLRWAGRARKDVVAWVRRRGGYCDCEVLMNALDGPAPRHLPAGVVCAAAATWWAAPEGCEDEDCDAADEVGTATARS